jgi:hypothetical protein
VVIHYLHVPSVSLPELESDPPPAAGRNRPLTPADAAEAVKAHRRQTSQVFEAFGLIKQPQASPGQVFVKAGKAALPLLGKPLSGPVGP